MFPDVCCYEVKPYIKFLQKNLTEYEEMTAMTSYPFFFCMNECGPNHSDSYKGGVHVL